MSSAAARSGNVLLYTAADGNCMMKREGEVEIGRFSDILEAISFAQALPHAEGASLTVFDVLGEVIFQVPITMVSLPSIGPVAAQRIHPNLE